MNDDTMSGAAQRAEEDRSYRAVGKQVVENQKFAAKAAPLVTEARATGEQVGAQKLAEQIQSQRVEAIKAQEMAAMAAEQARRQENPYGLAAYAQNEGMI